MNKAAIFLAILSAQACLCQTALAHGGPSFEAKAGGYLIDIGYDDAFVAGKETLMDFGIYTVKNNKPDVLALATSVTFSFSTGSTVLFSKTIKQPDFGKIFSVYTPQAGGNYILNTSFESKDKNMASASFPVFIEGAAQEKTLPSSWPIIAASVLLLAFCITAAKYYFRNR